MKHVTSPRVLVYDPVQSLSDQWQVMARLLDQEGVFLEIPISDSDSDSVAGDAEIIVVTGRRQIGRDTIQDLRRCVGIVCYSVGMDQVDVDAASEVGIPVTNIPGYCTEEVSNHAMTLLLAAERRLPKLIEAATRPGWSFEPGEFGELHRLSTQVLGVIGAGRIGTRVADKARAFGFTTVAHDPYSNTERPELPLIPLDELLAIADAIVLCAALNESTSGLIDADALSRMKRGVILVNVSRGQLIDEKALAVSLRQGHVACAALDVRSQEPPDQGTDVLGDAPNVIQTPHMGAYSIEALLDLTKMASESAISLLNDAGILDSRIP